MLSCVSPTNLFLGLIISINLAATVWQFRPSINLSAIYFSESKSHTYIGKDFPQEFPVHDIGTVAMTLQESIHYSLNGSDAVSRDEWFSVSGHIKGYGRVRLGPDHRVFLVAFCHQLHCLRQIYHGFMNRDDPEATPEHLQHCFSYLRQTIMCSALDTLEKGDFMNTDFEVDRIRTNLICRDWEAIFNQLGQNYDDWSEWKAEWD